jgi:hypothetical protein
LQPGVRAHSLFAAGLLVVAAAAAAAAQSGPSAPDPASVLTREADGRVVIRATRVPQPLVIDGRLDDAAYREVPSFSGFIQADPQEGAPSTERTEAWVLFDDSNLYITVRCYDSNPAGIVATEMRRDNARLNQNDNVAVGLDTFYDGRNGFQFNVGAAGGQRDGTVVDEAFQADWNGVYDAATDRDNQGWTAELAIPFKTLRYPAGRQQTWHIQIRRVIRSNGKNELTFITPMRASFGLFGTNKFTLAATLVGLEVPPPALNFEIKPYAIAPLTTDLLARPAVRNDFAPDGGLDIKYGITKSLTADFTVNTDFAQVEADEAQINLTRFNLSFPEKRDFFLEGQGLFNFGVLSGNNAVPSANAPTLFYSRSIGLSGNRSVPVLGGGRITGRAGPWSIGAFNMETDDDDAARAAQTNFTVMRVRRNILQRSTIGGIFTRRSVSTVAPGANSVYGADVLLALFENVYFNGYAAKSETPTLEGDDLSYRAQFHYNADRYGVMLDRNVVPENFNPEVGFMRRFDFRRNFAELRISPRTANHPIVRRWVTRASIDYITDNDDVLESRELQASFRPEFQSGDSVAVEYSKLFELLEEPFQIAQGIRIPIGGYDFHNTRLAYTRGGQRRLSGTWALEIGDFYSGTRKAAEYRGRIDFTNRIGFEPTITLNWIDLPQGSFETTIVGGRGVLTLSPRMFATALVQRSSSNNAISTNLRFRWEYRPGSELFVVYSEGRSTLPQPGIEALQNRGIVIKINRLFRF